MLLWNRLTEMFGDCFLTPKVLGVSGITVSRLGLAPRCLPGEMLQQDFLWHQDLSTLCSQLSFTHLLMKKADSRIGINLPVSWNNADTGKCWLHSSHSWINKSHPIKYGMRKSFVWSSSVNMYYIKEDVGGKMGSSCELTVTVYQSGKWTNSKKANQNWPLVHSLVVHLPACTLGFWKETKAVQRHFVTRTRFQPNLSDTAACLETQS